MPADFFCSGSEPFTGRVVWGGVPLVTQPKDALNGTDTIVQRLDDAVFKREGCCDHPVAGARPLAGQHRADPHQLRSFHVAAKLDDGEQPTTKMRIVRAREGGGSFESVLELNVRLTLHSGQGRHLPRADGAGSPPKLNRRSLVHRATAAHRRAWPCNSQEPQWFRDSRHGRRRSYRSVPPGNLELLCLRARCKRR